MNIDKKQLKKYITIVCFIFILFCIYICITYYLNHIKKYKLRTDQVFVCDDKDNYSKFDNWLKKDLEIDWVPTFVIIYNNKVIGSFPSQNIEDLENKMSSLLLAYENFNMENLTQEQKEQINKEFKDISNEKITNLDDETLSLKDLTKDGGLYILEVHKSGCPDCINYDKKYANDINKKYRSMIYRYYIKSTKKDVQKKYK